MCVCACLMGGIVPAWDNRLNQANTPAAAAVVYGRGQDVEQVDGAGGGQDNRTNGLLRQTLNAVLYQTERISWICLLAYISHNFFY